MSDASRSTPLDEDEEPFDLERESLDRADVAGIDWGGDGTDLSRPVRAHVLAALRPNTAPYPPPLDELLTLGDPRGNAEITERRQALGITQEHLPDLLRMARDRDLYTADSDTDEVWAPFHAFQALSELDVSGVVSELIPLFDLDEDSLFTEVAELLGAAGEPALEPLRAYLADRTRWGFGQWHAADALEQIGKQHPELREQAVAILSDVLRDAEHYSEGACTGVMDCLVGLEAVEALPVIRHAFELGRIDEAMRGPWGQVLDDLGVEPEEGDPLLAESQRSYEERQERFLPREKRAQLLEALNLLSEQPPSALEALGRQSGGAPLRSQAAQPATPAGPARNDVRKSAQDKARKQKNKRKMEAASRKANRRKRK